MATPRRPPPKRPIPGNERFGDIHFTATEKRLLLVLADGWPHHRNELKGCINDELAGPGVLRCHISNLRMKLHTIGEGIICELRERTIFYRHVRMLASATSGYK